MYYNTLWIFSPEVEMIILILKYENGMAIETGVAKCTKTIYYIYSREVQVFPNEQIQLFYPVK